MRISATLHTTQNLGDHGRETDISVHVTELDTIADLIERAEGVSPHSHLAEGADSITLRMVQG